jgi:hypothetical protein
MPTATFRICDMPAIMIPSRSRLAKRHSMEMNNLTYIAYGKLPLRLSPTKPLFTFPQKSFRALIPQQNALQLDSNFGEADAACCYHEGKLATHKRDLGGSCVRTGQWPYSFSRQVRFPTFCYLPICSFHMSFNMCVKVLTASQPEVLQTSQRFRCRWEICNLIVSDYAQKAEAQVQR